MALLIRSVVMLIVVAAAASAQAVYDQPASWQRTITLELVAPENKNGGEPWDLNPIEAPFLCIPGTPACAGSSRVGSTRPEMWLILIDSAGNVGGYQTRRSQRNAPTANPIQPILNPASVTSSARCSDAVVCLYRNIQVPNGAFGIVVLDEDAKEHDFMMTSIVYDPDEVDDVTIEKIERHVQDYLEKLRRNKQLSGGPPATEPIEIRSSNDCTIKVCFLDELAGVAGIKLTLSQPLTPGIRCSESTLSGELSYESKATGEFQFRFDEKANSCTGGIEFTWDFGDGDAASSTQRSVTHAYEKPGEYKVIVTASCAQRVRSCQSAPTGRTVTVK